MSTPTASESGAVLLGGGEISRRISGRIADFLPIFVVEAGTESAAVPCGIVKFGRGIVPRPVYRLKMNCRKIANGLSWGLHPFLLPLYLMLVLLTLTAFSRYSPGAKFYLLWVVVLYTIVIPLLSLGVLRKLGRISDYRIDDRRERLLPLLIGAICYVLCAITLAKLPSAAFLRKFMIAAACCETMCLLVSTRWKISLHLTGMGAAVAMLVVMNIVGVGDMLVPLTAVILLSGALASARLYLGCHNPLQVAAGFFGGFAVAVLAVLFL